MIYSTERKQYTHFVFTRLKATLLLDTITAQLGFSQTLIYKNVCFFQTGIQSRSCICFFKLWFTQALVYVFSSCDSVKLLYMFFSGCDSLKLLYMFFQAVIHSSSCICFFKLGFTQALVYVFSSWDSLKLLYMFFSS